jgi:hypothetical protein
VRFIWPLIVGVIVSLGGAYCAVGATLVASASGPDQWYGSGTSNVETATHALVLDVTEISGEEVADDVKNVRSDGGGWRSNGKNIDRGSATIKVGDPDSIAARATGTGTKPVFMGIAPATDVRRYLDDVAQEEISDVEYPPLHFRQRAIGGTKEPVPPASQDIWVASAQGVGEQHVEWSIDDGEYLVIVMNADGSAGVSTELAVGVGIEYFTFLAVGVALVGAFSIAAGIALIAVSASAAAHKLRSPGSRPE